MVVKDYKRLIEKEQKLNDNLRNLGRARDLKVDKINAKYQYKIDCTLRELSITKLLIDASKKFIEEN